MRKRLTTFHILLIGGIMITACNSNTTNKAQDMADSVAAKTDTAMKEIKQGAENMASDVKNAMSSNEDSDFVVKAAFTNNTELRILQAGVDNGTNKELRAHAKMMIADHRKLGEKVKSYSGKKGYVLPETDNGKADDELNKLKEKTKGADWDKEWTDHMVSAHEDAISSFEKGRDKVKDGDLKTIISGALPTLHSHLDMMKQLKDKLK